MKRASEIFKEVDPHLNVIDRGSRRTGRKGTSEQWRRSGGAFCLRCGQEAVRFNSYNGLCTQCNQELIEKEDKEEKKLARQRKFIQQHNARLKKKRVIGPKKSPSFFAGCLLVFSGYTVTCAGF